MRLQMGAQRVGRVAFEGARRNRVARPGQYGRGDQQRFVLDAVVLDEQRLAMRFGHVGQGAVSIRMILLEMVECGVERGLVAVADYFREQCVELGFPEAVFGAAARREERERQTDQLVGIGRETFGDSRAHKSGGCVQRTIYSSRFFVDILSTRTAGSESPAVWACPSVKGALAEAVGPCRALRSWLSPELSYTRSADVSTSARRSFRSLWGRVGGNAW